MATHTGKSVKSVSKHVLIYESEHGKGEKGDIIIFKDGNTLNFEPSNLDRINRKVLVKANLHRYSKQPPEVKDAVLALSKLEAVGNFRVILK
jgi:hypothetical protein